MQNKSTILMVFYDLSTELVEVKDLKIEISNYYFELLLNEYGNDFMNLLNNYKITKKFESNDSEKKLKNIIIYLWYTSEFITRSEMNSFFNISTNFNKESEFIHKTPLGYYNAILWKAISAHPIGLTGGYFGYWKYKPEN